MFRLPVDDSLDLVLLEPRHAGMLFALVDDNRAHLRRYLPWVDSTHTVSDSLAFVQRSLEQLSRAESLQVALFTRGAMAGMCGYHIIDWNNRRTSVGYWLAEGFQGKGLMTRAVRGLSAHAFGPLGLHRLEIRMAPDNLQSRKVAERAGYHPEGTSRGAEWLHDRFVDHLVFSLLSPEFRAKGG